MAKQGFRVLDSDMHVMEPPDLWTRYIDPKFRDIAPVGTTTQITDLRTVFPTLLPTIGPSNINRGKNFERMQRIYADHAARGFTSECQLEAMDIEGIDVAVAEAHRVVKELGFRAVFLRSNICNGKVWHDPYYEPLWDALEELEVPLGFHEATGSRTHQVGEQFAPNFGLRRVYSQPVTQMMGLGSFTVGGILARHPKLKVAFLEANCSWAPWLLWRLDEGWELEGDVFMPDLTMKPSDYFRRQCWISIEPDETPARHMIDDFGCDQLVFSTDYPHSDSRYPHAVEAFLELESLPDEDKRKILWDNCARFYTVEEPAAVS